MIRSAALVLLVGCAGTPDAKKPAGPVAPSASVSVDAGPPEISFDDLSSRGARSAPLMRELARVNGSTKLEAKDRDTCFRASVSGPSSIAGRAETAGDTWVPPSGPICLKKGQSTTLETNGRAVIFVAP